MDLKLQSWARSNTFGHINRLELLHTETGYSRINIVTTSRYMPKTLPLQLCMKTIHSKVVGCRLSCRIHTAGRETPSRRKGFGESSTFRLQYVHHIAFSYIDIASMFSSYFFFPISNSWPVHTLFKKKVVCNCRFKIDTLWHCN